MLARAAIPRELAGRPVEIWFQDEPSIRLSKALRALEPLAHSVRVGKPRRADPHLGGAGQRFRRAERDGRPAEGKRGTRPRIRRDRRFTWAKPAKGSGRRSLLEWPAEGYLFGAICPARGTGAALVMPTVSIEAMNQHLEPTSGTNIWPKSANGSASGPSPC